MAMLELLRGMRGKEVVTHGFRSTFTDWVAERTAHSSDVVEAALSHTLKSKVEAAYRRGDLFEKRRQLMNSWSTFCAERDGVVIPLHA
jgi:integrase